MSQKSKETLKSQTKELRDEASSPPPPPLFNVDNQAIIPFLLEKRDISRDGGYVMQLQCPNYFWPSPDCRR